MRGSPPALPARTHTHLRGGCVGLAVVLAAVAGLHGRADRVVLAYRLHLPVRGGSVHAAGDTVRTAHVSKTPYLMHKNGAQEAVGVPPLLHPSLLGARRAAFAGCAAPPWPTRGKAGARVLVRRNMASAVICCLHANTSCKKNEHKRSLQVKGNFTSRMCRAVCSTVPGLRNETVEGMRARWLGVSDASPL